MPPNRSEIAAWKIQWMKNWKFLKTWISAIWSVLARASFFFIEEWQAKKETLSNRISRDDHFPTRRGQLNILWAIWKKGEGKKFKLRFDLLVTVPPFLFMTAEAAFLLIPAVPVCQRIFLSLDSNILNYKLLNFATYPAVFVYFFCQNLSYHSVFKTCDPFLITFWSYLRSIIGTFSFNRHPIFNVFLLELFLCVASIPPRSSC